MRALLVGLAVVTVGCDPKTVDYEITVNNDFPGTRIGIYPTEDETPIELQKVTKAPAGTLPLATTTKATDKLVVHAPFKQRLVPRVVDLPIRPVSLAPILGGPDARTLARAGKVVPMTLHASRIADVGLEFVEVVLASPTDEPITVGEVHVDSKAVEPGMRLVVPVKTGTVVVKVGTAPAATVEVKDRRSDDAGPGAFVYVDPSASMCLQMRTVVYAVAGVAKLIAGDKPEPPVQLAPAKLHVFARADEPQLIFDEKVPEAIRGVSGSRKILEHCTPAGSAARKR